ncbi:MAG: hypothetical protein AB7F96_20445 [Beijerinckiaceae bacterium]
MTEYARRSLAPLLAFACLPFAALPLHAQTAPPQLQLRLTGPQETMFRPGEGCDGHDVPDLNPRAFRDAGGQIVMFALHYINRPLRGPSLDALKVDCKVAFGSPNNADPAKWATLNWIAATWTGDGKRIEAIVHHEYHADQHGRCNVPKAARKPGLTCWYNALLAARSNDGGASFARHAYPVVAAPPFRQELEQQRHRGFFNPSNIFSDGKYKYFFAAETGWPGQMHGVCLFRSADPGRPRSWRAFDGKAFSIRYDDPYRKGMTFPQPCKPIAPFPAQVGAVVKHRPSGQWLAVVQAWKDEKNYPVSGFYYATSRDLLNWSLPRLLMATKSLYDDACGAGVLNSYPSILDPNAKGRNFDDAGASAWLYWSAMRVQGCSHTGDRRLMRRKILFSAGKR